MWDLAADESCGYCWRDVEPRIWIQKKKKNLMIGWISLIQTFSLISFNTHGNTPLIFQCGWWLKRKFVDPPFHISFDQFFTHFRLHLQSIPIFRSSRSRELHVFQFSVYRPNWKLEEGGRKGWGQSSVRENGVSKENLRRLTWSECERGRDGGRERREWGEVASIDGIDE